MNHIMITNSTGELGYNNQAIAYTYLTIHDFFIKIIFHFSL